MTQTVTQSVSDSVRDHVRDVYVKPAIRRGEKLFTVKAGAVHKALTLTNRVPLVCAALKSKKLLEESNLRLVSQTGPPSGMSTTTTFTYEILGGQQATSAPSFAALTALRGIARDIFQGLGGGEAFIRSERRTFASESEKRDEAAKR